LRYLNAHKQTVHNKNVNNRSCRFCGKSFKSLIYWKRHENLCQNRNNFKSLNGVKLVPYDSSDDETQMQSHPSKRAKTCQNTANKSSDDKCISFRNVLSTYVISPNSENQNDLQLFLLNSKSEVYSKLSDDIILKKNLKWYMVVEVQFRRAISGSEGELCTSFFLEAIVKFLLNMTI